MRAQVRREQILRAAAGVFMEKGYHRASVSDIIAAANIARGTFYLYFEGKREIFAELVDVLTVRLINCMKRVDLSPGSPPWIDQIRANLVRIMTILIEERELNQILYNHALGLDEDFDRKIREFYDNIIRRTEAAFLLGQQMGLVRPEVKPDLAARAVVGAFKEAAYYLARQPESSLSAEEVVDELLNFTLRSVLLLKATTTPAAAKSKKKSSARKK